MNTLVEQQSDQKSERSKSLTEEVELEYPPELIELMRKPFNQLTEKERAKIIKLKNKYDEKLRKLKEKQEAKLKKEMEKQQKKAEEEKKKSEKARKKEEEKAKKTEEKARKDDEKKFKKLKEEEDKKPSKKLKDDAKNLDLKNETDLKIKDEEILENVEKDLVVEKEQTCTPKIVEKEEDFVSINKLDLINKTEDLQQIVSQDNNLQIKKDDDESKFNNKNALLEAEDTITNTSSNTIEEDNKKKESKKGKPVKVPRTKKLSPIDNQKDAEKQKINNKAIEAESENKQSETELIIEDNQNLHNLKEDKEDLTKRQSNDNLLEVENIRGLSPNAKLSNKLFKKSSIDDTTITASTTNLASLSSTKFDNLPLIILPSKEKSATLDDRLLRRRKSPKLTSVEQLDFHHLDNVGCLDGSIRKYFHNFESTDNLRDLLDSTTSSSKVSKYKERRSISPIPTSTIVHHSNFDVPTFSSSSSSSKRLKRHTISAKRSPPLYLNNLRTQLNTLNNAELSFLASQMKENKFKPPSSNQFEMINKSYLSTLHHTSELSVSTPCLSELIKPQSYLPFIPYLPSIDRHLSTRSAYSGLMSMNRKLSPIQMPLLNIPIDLHVKTESMPSLSRQSSYCPFLSHHSTIRTTTRSPMRNQQFVYNETGDVYYRDTIYQLKRIEEQLKRLKQQFDSSANLSILDAKSTLSRVESRKLPELSSGNYKYHCTINLIKDEVNVKAEDKIDLDSNSSDQSRTKLYFRIYKQLGCNHVGSSDLTTKIHEHENEFRAFCPPYVCVLCYYTVIAIHYLMKQGYDLNQAIQMVKKKQEKEKDDRWKHRSTIRIDSKDRLNTINYLPSYSKCKSPIGDSYSNVCHQATTHLNHHQHYSYERSHDKKFYLRDEYLNFKSNLDHQRPKSPSSLRSLDCLSPTSTVNKSACNSLYHTSYKTSYSRFQSDYMKRKSRVEYPFLRDTNFKKAEVIWNSKNN